MLVLLTVFHVKTVAQSYDDYGVPLITDASQLSSNASDANDGQHLEYLLDNNLETYWHSDWHGQTNESLHWLQVELPQELLPGNEVSVMMLRRADVNTDHPTELCVWTSVDGEEFTELKTVSIPFDGAGNTSYSETFSVNEPVKFLRFAATKCASSYRKFWHCAEFQLITITSQQAAVIRLNQIYMKYDGYVYGDTKFDVGKDYGQYDAEAQVNEFLEKLNKGYNDVLYQDEEKWPSADYINALSNDIERLYQEILNSQVVFHLPGNGYYRIFTNLNYYEEKETGETDADGNPVKEKILKPKAMYSSMDGFGMWGDYDPKDCRFLWKIEETENGVDMMNAATEFRFDKMARPVTMSAEAKTKMAFDFAGKENGRDIVYIRSIADNFNLGSSIFLHQWNHSRGAGKGGQMCVWKGTFEMGEEYTSDKGASEWYLEPVQDDEVAALIKSFEPVKNHDVLVTQYEELINKANDAISQATGVEGICTPNLDDPKITDVTQFSSNFTETAEGSITSLLDGDPTTYWHSKWKGGNVKNHTHCLDISFSEPLPAGAYQVWIQRRGNSDKDDNVVLMSVYGSNDESALSSLTEDGWTFIASNLNAPWSKGVQEVFMDPFDMRKSYKYLRFYNDGTNGPTASKRNRGFFHVGGFQLYSATKSGSSQIDNMGEIGTNLIDEVAVAKELLKTPDAITYDGDFKRLEAAYEAFMEILVDPQELRDVIASVEGVTNLISIGNSPGQWSSRAEADALAALLEEAVAYNQSGMLSKEKSSEYAERIKAAREAFFNASQKVDPSQWYLLRFPTEDFFQKYELKSDGAKGSEYGDSFGRCISIAELDGEIRQTSPYNVREGSHLFLVSEPADQDLAKFRFVEVEEGKYVIQNKATGLFITCQGASNSNVTLSLTPSVFNISAIGYGEILLHATSIKGEDFTNLSLQNNDQRIVTANASTPGSNSAWFIEPTEESVDEDFSPVFYKDIVPGKIYPMCYPVSISSQEGTFFSVEGTYTAEDKNYVALNQVENTIAGVPYVFVFDGIESYVPAAEGETQETCVIGFNVSTTDFSSIPATKNGYVGTYDAMWIDPGIVVFNENKVVAAEGEDRTECTRNVAANGGYVLFGQTEADASAEYDLSLEIGGDANVIKDTYLMFRSDLSYSAMITNVLAPYTYQCSFQGLDPFIGVGVLLEDLSEDQTIIAFEYQCSEDLVDGEFFFNPIRAGREQHYQTLEAASDWTPAYVDISASRINFDWGKAGDWLRWDPVSDGKQNIKARNFEIITREEMDLRITGVHDIISSSPLKSINNSIFDLTGRRVMKMQKGIYIKDGKKVLVK